MIRKTTILFCALLFCSQSGAEDFHFSAVVRDKAGKLLDDAVVVAIPLGKQVGRKSNEAPARIVQEDEMFHPMVTVIEKGKSIVFPNNDNFNHHIYSMSKPKPFEMPLYKKTDKLPKPVKFDKTGIVVLGCNIHDEMIAYIVIVDSPFFSKSVKGQVEVKVSSPGAYRIEAWHSTLGQKMKIVVPKQELSKGSTVPLNIEM